MDNLTKRGYSGFIRVDSGGQGNVYKSFKNGKTYAIKVVRIEESDQAKLDDDIRRELNITNSIRHPNCMHVEELFRTMTRVYIVMDFMPNGSIGHLVRRGGPLDEWNVKAWFPAIARAVKYLHEHNIAHR